ncbi:alanine--tRNA ligase-related protein [Microbacterium sp. P06]|uniref:alanine--tRNA ligase-related protein n=1 Tax=Microbacterium sp. P06 TaxID=3366949 RepID=UPI0037452824
MTMTMTADEIRRAFLDYMAERGHVIIPRAPLIPRDDPSTLFTGSGMQPLLPYLLGAEHPGGRRLADSQTCLRVQDIEEVGDNRHTTFFEMLGNWSLGEYFKEEQIPQIWTFLTEKVGLVPDRIFVSCFSGDPGHGIPKDEDSAGIWSRLFVEAGISADQVDLGTEERAAEVGTNGARIAFYGKKNWWCRGGNADEMPLGEPGGTDTEIFYLFPQVEHDPAFGANCHQNCDCGRFIELGNSVFMEYQRTAEGFAPLPRRNVDYGGGLARIAAAAIDSPDVFRIGLLWPIIERLEELSGASYDDQKRSMRVIADHLRGATFLAVDGVTPSNKAQGYVMRRLIRRAVRFAFDLGLEENFFPQIIPTIAGIYAAHFPEVGEHAEYVEKILAKEEQSFRRTLRKGLKQLSQFAKTGVTGRELFVLSDTFGFPVELSTEEAERKNIALSENWREEFDEQLAAQRAQSQRRTTLHV